MIKFAENLNKMIAAGLGGALEAPRTEVAVGHRIRYLELSGTVASFETNIVAPIQSLRVDMQPIQAGSGDPSPDNIRPITGRDSVTVERTGVNLFDVGQMHLNKRYNGSDYTGESAGTFKLPPGTYVIKLNETSVFSGVAVARSKKPYPFTLSEADLNGTVNIQTASSHMATYVIDDTYPYIYVAPSTPTATTEADFANAKIQLELGSTPSAYAPYDGASVTVQLGQTVYGGTVDVTTGVLTVDRVKITLDGTQDISVANWRPQTNAVGWLYPYTLTNNFIGGGTVKQNVICDRLSTIAYNSMPSINGNGIALANALPYGIAIMQTDTTLTTKSAINAYLSQNPLEVVYEPAEPIEITGLTTASLSTLKGDNNVWSDAGNISLEYPYYEETEGY